MANVRVDDALHNRLRDLAEATGLTMSAVIDRAVEAYEDAVFWRRSDLAWDALRHDPQAWAIERAERAESAGTLLDDLEGDPYPMTDDGRPVPR